MDNPELLGLEDICRKPNVLGPTSHQPEEVSESEEPMFNWVAAAIAYGPGVFCGFVIGYYIFTSGYHEWFAERFGRRKIRVVTSRSYSRYVFANASKNSPTSLFFQME
ncbi:unnamed protein product [Brassica oleracea var. botrytis]|uniref:(rape) hypothetical protein n=1 Tax=Brassica napus TaxID=3708 RepID=A0A816QSP4_BRANA|nr:unnamed protein product [Brassica napus]